MHADFWVNLLVPSVQTRWMIVKAPTMPASLKPETNIEPEDNELLATLSAEVFSRLFPDLKPVAMSLGKVICDSGGQLEHVGFPAPGSIVSMLYVMEDGASAEIAVVGDRPGLEAQLCECYAVVKKVYDRLLPEQKQ